MPSEIARNMRTKKEKAYQALMIIFGVPLWVLFFLIILNINPAQIVQFVPLIIIGLTFILHLFILAPIILRATAFGNHVLLGPNQFPKLYDMVVDGAKTLGMSPPPDTFLFNSGGIISAFAHSILGGRYVFLTSALVDANNDEQIRFVIGHELGHHAAGHFNPWLGLLRFPARLIPFLSPAYSRAREYTCDEIGASLARDPNVSSSALLMLGCGCMRLNREMNCDAFLAQEAMVPPVFGFLTEIFRGHPRLTRRVAAIGKVRGII